MAGNSVHAVSLNLDYNGELVEHSFGLHASSTCEDTPEGAWALLSTVGSCDMVMRSDNLPRLREMHREWLAGKEK